MYYPRELIDEIRLQNDIVDVISGYVPLKQKGGSYFGLCPFHNENTPSFSVSADKQLYYCFGCGASGNVISFVMQAENCDFAEAVEKLAQRAHIKLPEPEFSEEMKQEENLKNRLRDMHSAAGRFYYDILQTDEGVKAKDYLDKRKIDPAIRRKFGLGYAPGGKDRLYKYLLSKGYKKADILRSGLVLEDKNNGGIKDRFYNRLMFPIFDIRGRAVGFGGRIIDKGEPKYLNSPETIIFNKKQNLYGLNFAKESKKKELILVEGYMDMLTIYQAGFKNVAASLGTAFNREHTRTIKNVATDVILIFDSDEAGTKAALRAIPVLVSGGFKLKVAQVPDGKDPDEYIKQNGSAAFAKLLVDAESYVTFRIRCAGKNYNLENTEQKIDYLTEVAKILSEIDSSIERDVYLKEVAAKTGIDGNAIESEILRLRRNESEAFRKKSEAERKRLYENGGAFVSGAKGTLQAQQNLLFICATNLRAYSKIKQFMSPEDYIDGVYIKLAEIIYRMNDEDEKIVPADMVNYFTTVEEQKRVSEVFSVKFNYENNRELEKALTEEVVLLKKIKADYLSRNASSAEDIQKVIEIKKNLTQINIVLGDHY
ncbi:MAG: DNA primase [Firmicutes bacterium]|nr:DNA primase [Bacillota bacterium]